MTRHRLCIAVCLALSGCEPESLGFTEIKRLHEVVSPGEWASFVRIVDRMPDRRVPAFPAVFPPPPHWDHRRSARICDLYAEELGNRDAGWNTGEIMQIFERHRLLVRELRKEKMTPEQFAGLVLTLGAATCRNEVPDGVDLAALSDRARPFLDSLAQDVSPFSSLNRESQHVVLQKAMWIARKVRADKLKQVPAENLALVEKHRDWLHQALPSEFLDNPPDEIRDLLEERGMPFEELPESGSDDDLHWQQAGVIGTR